MNLTATNTFNAGIIVSNGTVAVTGAGSLARGNFPRHHHQLCQLHL